MGLTVVTCTCILDWAAMPRRRLCVRLVQKTVHTCLVAGAYCSLSAAAAPAALLAQRQLHGCMKVRDVAEGPCQHQREQSSHRVLPPQAVWHPARSSALAGALLA